MTDLHDSLPDLMRRATVDLQPATPDLVARGIRRGKVLRRRRTALAGLSGAAAELATVGVILSGNQALRVQPATPAVSPPPTHKPVKPSSSGPVTPAATLATLTSLLPNGLAPTSSTTSGGYGLGTNQASVLLDDGAGLAADAEHHDRGRDHRLQPVPARHLHHPGRPQRARRVRRPAGAPGRPEPWRRPGDRRRAVPSRRHPDAGPRRSRSSPDAAEQPARDSAVNQCVLERVAARPVQVRAVLDRLAVVVVRDPRRRQQR